MWQANKACIIFLLAGLAAVVTAYFLIRPEDALMAERVLSTGICAMLFVTACISYLLARRGMKGD